MVETAVAGIGPFNRKWKGFEEKGLEYGPPYALVIITSALNNDAAL